MTSVHSLRAHIAAQLGMQPSPAPAVGRCHFWLRIAASLVLGFPCLTLEAMAASPAASAADSVGRASRPCEWAPLCRDLPARGAVEADAQLGTVDCADRSTPRKQRAVGASVRRGFSFVDFALAVDPKLNLDASAPQSSASMCMWRASDRSQWAGRLIRDASAAYAWPPINALGVGVPHTTEATPLGVARFGIQDGAAPVASPPVASDPMAPVRGADRGQVQPAGAENAPTDDEITPQLEEAVRKGFEYLRRQQKADGAFGQGRFGQHVGVTSLCAIAFMADGNVPGRGDFSEQVEKALDFVLTHSTETGLLVSDQTHGPMYGHGFATLFLGEIYGMNRDDDRVRDALVRAVQLIVASQNNEGGWRYNPVPDDADVSVTICQVMALRSARNAGIKVPKSTIDDATRYVRACQNADGGFRYMKDLGGSAWPRTAAGVASLFYAGVYEDQSIERGLDYLRQHAFPRGQAGGVAGGFSQPHYFYGHYYAVQAMYLAGGDRWKTWWPAIRDELLAKQGPDGSWTDPQGDAYGTAMALIVLQMPKRYLPIFQR